jgi:hypothetical protein
VRLIDNDGISLSDDGTVRRYGLGTDRELVHASAGQTSTAHTSTGHTSTRKTSTGKER